MATTTTGREIALDGDLLAVMETLFHEVTAKRELEPSLRKHEPRDRALVAQMTDEERSAYLIESLSLNQVNYENDKLDSYMRRIGKEVTDSSGDGDLTFGERIGGSEGSEDTLGMSAEPPRRPLTPARGPGRSRCSSATGASSAAAPTRMRSGCSATPAPRRSRRSGPGPPPRQLRHEINGGGSSFCGDCPLKLPLAPDQPPPQRAARRRRRFPAGCTSSAPRPATSPASRRAARRRPASREHARRACSTSTSSRGSSTKPGPRSAGSTSSTTARPSCTSAPSRCARTSRRSSRTSTSTRAPTAWPSPKRRRGSSRTRASTRSPSPRRRVAGDLRAYRQRGKFDMAIANLRAMIDEKAKSGRDVPFINWRYILFNWNDSDAEMERARRMADDLGVDRLCWEITDHPEDSFSRRFAPGTPDFHRIRHEVWDDNDLGNAIAGATPRAEIVVHTVMPGLPLARPGDAARDAEDRSAQSLRRGRFGRRQLRPAPGPPRRAIDDERRHDDQPRSRPRLAAGGHPARRERGGRRSKCRAPEQPGRYALKFDLVSEGIDWFEIVRLADDGEAARGARLRERRPLQGSRDAVQAAIAIMSSRVSRSTAAF